MSAGLFELRTARRLELRGRAHQFYPDLPPLVLRKGELVQVLDIFTSGFYCETRHGNVVLSLTSVRPLR